MGMRQKRSKPHKTQYLIDMIVLGESDLENSAIRFTSLRATRSTVGDADDRRRIIHASDALRASAHSMRVFSASYRVYHFISPY